MKGLWMGLVVCALSAAAPCGALPVAGAYPSRQDALAAPNDLERQAFGLIEKDRASMGLPRLEYDPLLSAVAREHSEDMAQHGYCEYASPRLGTLEYRMHRAGISAGNCRFAIFRMGSLDSLLGELRRVPFHREQATHLGIGIASKGILAREISVTLISCEKHSTLDPFPTQPIYGRIYRLSGRIDAGYSNAQLMITTPDGKVTETPLGLLADHRFETRVGFDHGVGEYMVEIGADGRLGPQILDLMRCYSGVPYPEPPAPPAPVRTPDDLRQAERMIFDMINRSRAEAGLRALAYDDRLAAVAREHSEDMNRNKFFAHVSPTMGDLTARLGRAGIKARKFTENIAANSDLGGAHRGLMDSPGHRKNILDPEVDAVGVGIVRDADNHLVVTEEFMRAYVALDTDALAAELLRGINAARVAGQVNALNSTDALQRIALENSRDMAKSGRLGYDKARALMGKANLHYHYLQTSVLKSADPALPEQMRDVLKARFQDVGVGVVQSSQPTGEKLLWTTVVLGEK